MFEIKTSAAPDSRVYASSREEALRIVTRYAAKAAAAGWLLEDETCQPVVLPADGEPLSVKTPVLVIVDPTTDRGVDCVIWRPVQLDTDLHCHLGTPATAPAELCR